MTSQAHQSPPDQLRTPANEGNDASHVEIEADDVDPASERSNINLFSSDTEILQSGMGEAGDDKIYRNDTSPAVVQSDLDIPSPLPQRSSGLFLPSLPGPLFDHAYRQFCIKNNLTLDPNMLQLEGRQIDLHSLHTEVTRAGGPSEVTEWDLWPAIGGKLGFVLFPGSDTEPARSSPVVAEHIMNVYWLYLAAFNQAYIQSIMAHKKARSMLASQANSGMTIMGQMQHGNSPLASGSNMPIQQGMSADNLLAVQQRITALTGEIVDPEEMNMIFELSAKTAAELQGLGIPPELINLIETNRSLLRATLQTSQGSLH